MNDLFEPLNDEEMDILDRFLLDRIDEEDATEERDEGIWDVAELDGFFTAIVSGPTSIQPSQWLPAVWGDFEPVWDSEEAFKKILMLLMRHMNGIATALMENPEYFEPMFQERVIEGKTYTVVDEWCEGFRRGMMLAPDRWYTEGPEMTILLAPIMAFTSETKWSGHDFSGDECENIQKAIAPNVREIHAYWLARREKAGPASQPVRRQQPRVGRNDPCPCGSGKKYKKCCLH